jgi:hypothetical protein
MGLEIVSVIQLRKKSKCLLMAGYTEIWIESISISSKVSFPRFKTYNIVSCK